MPKPGKPTKRRPTASAVLDDGGLVEMILDEGRGETAFAVSSGGEIHVERAVEVPSGEALVPFGATNTLLTHGVVLLPSDAGDETPVDALVDGIRAFIHRYADVSESFEEIAAHYVLLTWVFDAFREVPYLRLKGDFGTGKSRCLQTIGSICYRPMFASGASTVSPLFRIIDMFRGTLVIDEGDFRFTDERAEITKILNNGNAAGFPVLRSDATPARDWSPRAFDVFGPKIIATRRAFDDPALESRCITETLSGLPPRPDIPLSLPRDFEHEALELRNRLLTYRFERRNALVGLVQRREADIEARVAQVMGPLLAVAADDGARRRIVEVARGMSHRVVAERSASIEAQLLDIIGVLRRDAEVLGIKRIAEEFVTRFGADHDRPITARWVGAQIRRRLSLTAIKSHGNFIIPETEYAKVSALLERYGIDERESGKSEGVTNGGPVGADA